MAQFRTKKAFTVIEISLFIAISGFMMVGIVAGTSTSVARQRYNDAVNSFVEFLRNVYSEVENVQNQRTAALTNEKCTLISSVSTDAHPGHSNCAIYGKLITFGESNDSQTIHVYDVVGEVLKDTDNKNAAEYNKDKLSADAVLTALGSVKADVISIKGGQGAPALNHYTYTPEWQARIEQAGAAGTTYKGSILIARSPRSGTIHTYVNNGKAISASTLFGTASPSTTSPDILVNYFPPYSPAGSFSNSGTLDFCIASDDYRAASSHPRNVRILADGNNSTAVRLVNADDTTAGGNKCE